ncbi:MAG TPA: YbhB/YbcL family Raf kinase inhibitor-like protein [Candidatus Limnocylindrales bacterium]|nr:YbhB/YbcL family Raf kinase inhibitor-like protein [Candidatus Limnocylindrales bacterium]
MIARAILALGLGLAVTGCAGPATSPTTTRAPASGVARTSTGMPSASGAASEVAPTAAASEAAVSTSPSSATFAFSSPAFASGASIPRKYSCDGAGVSPPLAWSGVPNGTKELELLVVDPDARGFVHWVAAGIPATTTGLDEAATGSNQVPIEGRNGAGRNGWTGPCPPSGTHHYHFTLYAVSRPLGLEDGVSADELRAAVGDATLGRAELVGTFSGG